MLFLLILLFGACKNEEIDKGFPDLIISSKLEISENGVFVTAKLSHEENYEITDYGLVFCSDNQNDESNYDHINLGKFSGGNSFRLLIDRNLKRDVFYLVKAFIKIKDKTIYSNEVSFLSLGANAPVIENFIPKSAYYNDTIVITGKHFSTRNFDNLLYFGTLQARVISSSDTRLKVLVPNIIESMAVPLRISVAGLESTLSVKFVLKKL